MGGLPAGPLRLLFYFAFIIKIDHTKITKNYKLLRLFSVYSLSPFVSLAALCENKKKEK